MSIFSNAQNTGKQQQKTPFFAGTQGGGFFGAATAEKDSEKDTTKQEPFNRADFVSLLLKNKKSKTYYWEGLWRKSAEEIMQEGMEVGFTTNGERPLDPITRIEAAAMLNRCEGIEGTDYNGEVYYFSDLYQNELEDWMFDAAHLSRMYGIFEGTLENEFLPFQTLDEETSKILIKRTAKLKQVSKVAQKARLKVSPLEEPAKKGEEIYESQRDNEPFPDFNRPADEMCNVTSVAMQLHTLAPKEEIKKQAIEIYYSEGGKPVENLENEQIEDILLRIVKHKGWNELYYKHLKELGELFEVTSSDQSYSFYGPDVTLAQFNGDASDAITDGNLDNAIKKGKGVIMSNTLYGSGGHYVHLVSVESDGIIVNDPYGFRINNANDDDFLNSEAAYASKMNRLKENWSTFEERSKHNPELKAEMEAFLENPEGTFSQQLGKLNFYNWEEVLLWNLGRWGTVMGK